MSIAAYPDLSRMMHSPVLIAARVKRIVGWQFVGVDHRAWQDPCFDERNKSIGLCVRDYLSNDRALSLEHTRDDSLTNRSATLNLPRANVFVHVLRLTTKIAF